MIIKDLDGREYKIPNLEEFKNHIKNITLLTGNPMAVYTKRMVIILESIIIFIKNYLVENKCYFQ